MRKGKIAAITATVENCEIMSSPSVHPFSAHYTSDGLNTGLTALHFCAWLESRRKNHQAELETLKFYVESRLDSTMSCDAF